MSTIECENFSKFFVVEYRSAKLTILALKRQDILINHLTFNGYSWDTL